MAKAQRNSPERRHDMFMRRARQDNFIHNNYKPYKPRGKYMPAEEDKKHAQT